MKTKSLTIFVVFGPQGSGKSTQVERLARRMGLKVFEAGEALRTRAKSDRKLRRVMQRGLLVSNETILQITKEFISVHQSDNGYVFDGYPRNHQQFNDLSKIVKQTNARMVGIFINLTDISAKQRLANRYTVVNGQRLFRDDDRPEIVQKRLDTFRAETLPLKELFAKHYGLLEVDGEPSVDVVTEEINAAVDKFLDAGD